MNHKKVNIITCNILAKQINKKMYFNLKVIDIIMYPNAIFFNIAYRYKLKLPKMKADIDNKKKMCVRRSFLFIPS